VDQYDQQLASLLASHHYHLTDTTRTPPRQHGQWMSRLGHSSRDDIEAKREPLPDADVKFLTLVDERDPRRHEEGHGYVIHRDSLLARGFLPRYLFLHFDGHVVVAIVSEDEKEVGVFDSRSLSQTAAIMDRYTHFFKNFFKKKRVGEKLVPKVTSLNTTVDMQTEGCYNCFAWSRYIVYRHLIGGEEPAAIVSAMHSLAHAQPAAGADHPCLLEEVFLYRTWAASLADQMDRTTGALTAHQVLAFSPAGQKSQQKVRKPRKRRRDGGDAAAVPADLVRDMHATRKELKDLRGEVLNLKWELHLTRKDAVAAANQAAVAQRQNGLMALALAATKKEAELALAGAKEAELALAAAKKEAELALAAAKKEAELALAGAKKEAELALAAAKKEAELALAAAKKEAELALAAAKKEAEAANERAEAAIAAAAGATTA
jgi:hypothetical protein